MQKGLTLWASLWYTFYAFDTITVPLQSCIPALPRCANTGGLLYIGLEVINMAEFCRECAPVCLGLNKDELRRAVFSREPDLCEGCGEMKPVLVEIKDNRLPKLIEKLLFGRYT